MQDCSSQELPKKHGITQAMVQLAMTKYAESPSFLQAMNQMTQEQKERFAAVGIMS